MWFDVSIDLKQFGFETCIKVRKCKCNARLCRQPKKIMVHIWICINFVMKDNLIGWQVERYDPIKGSWTAVTPMLTKRCRLGVATLNDKLYVCGGYDGATFLQSVEMYDPDTDKYVPYSI